MVIAHGGYDAIGHGLLPTEIGGQEAIVHSQQADDSLNAARSTGGVTRKALRTRYGWHLRAKHPFQGNTLTEVVVGCACAMGIDVLDILRTYLRHRQCLLHRQISSFPVF